MTLYICNKLDRNKRGCPEYCGECYLTKKPEYALNGSCLNPWAHPERFDRIDVKNDEGKVVWSEYIEKRPDGEQPDVEIIEIEEGAAE